MQRLRILVCSTGLATGGAERMLVKLITALSHRSCEFAVVSLLDAGTQGPHLREVGVPVYELQMKRPWSLPAVPMRLRQLVRTFDPHVVQGWMYHGNLAATIARSLAGSSARLLWGVRQTLYEMKMERPPTRAVIRINAALSGVPDQVIFNSQLSLEQHSSIGFRAQKGVVIPNGFDLGQFRPDATARSKTRQQLGIPEQAAVVGLVARYHPMKDHANFLRAAAAVARALPDAYFILAGKAVDSDNDRLANLLADAGLGRKVRLLGEVRDAQLLYPAFDVAVLSSAWGEAFPNVLGEAMACGVPCVSTDVGDARQIVGEAGQVVPRADSDGLAAAIVDVLRMGPEGRFALGERGRHRVEELFSLQAVACQYLALYTASRNGVRS